MDDIDLASAGTTVDLVHNLRQLRALAGNPSLRELEDRSTLAAGSPLACTEFRHVRMSRSALHALLSGSKFPAKAFLLTFVAACGVDLETDHSWEQAWDRLAVERRHHDADRVKQLRQDNARLWERVLQAEADNERLRNENAELRARTGSVDAGGGQVRRRPNLADIDYPTSIPRPSEPHQIGRYEVLGRLGAGAMSRVYLGRSPGDGSLVALKIIRPEFAEEPDFRARFAAEVEAMARVTGEFTAQLVGAEPQAEVPWLATEYVPGPTVSKLVQQYGPLPVPTVRWLAAGCARGLQSIHSAGLVHRDLKPSNVLVALDGPRVIDFGIASAVLNAHRTISRGILGTPAYMAPEQAREMRGVTLISDVYALGATILFAATGHGPYHGDSVMEVLAGLCTEDPDLSGLPTELIDVVTSCLSRDPRARPTLDELLAHFAPGADENRPAYLPQPVAQLITEFGRDVPRDIDWSHR